MDVDKAIKAAVDSVYRRRKARAVHPEGEFDRAGRWYPSAREDVGDDCRTVRGPSARWPYSYMLHCRTRKHCAILVRAATGGGDVPPDVSRALACALGLRPDTPVAIISDYVADGCPR